MPRGLGTRDGESRRMPRTTDKLLALALKLATKAVEERASAEDLEELALVVLELDEAVVLGGAGVPRRWTKARLNRARTV